MSFNRSLVPAVFDALQQGVLTPFCDYVRDDHTLMMALRHTGIDIYYRGGVLLCIRSASLDLGSYTATYDLNYGKVSSRPVVFDSIINNAESLTKIMEAIPALKQQIDFHRATHPAAEREAQQLIARENNRSAVSHETDYFIVDIEVAGWQQGAKFDMAAVRWKTHHMGQDPVVVPVLIELKNGTGALKGKSGLSKHLLDMRAMVRSVSLQKSYLDDLEQQLRQLDDLGLLRYHRSASQPPKVLTIDRDARPELVFIPANYNPASRLLAEFLQGSSDDASEDFDLRFFASCFAGYGMHAASMLKLEDFKQEVERLRVLATNKPLVAMNADSA